MEVTSMSSPDFLTLSACLALAMRHNFVVDLTIFGSLTVPENLLSFCKSKSLRLASHVTTISISFLNSGVEEHFLHTSESDSILIVVFISNIRVVFLEGWGQFSGNEHYISDKNITH